ncbi:hypothetical protein, partial [Mesorhizobium sp. M7A.F.Ca.CA.002.09.1.1]|uniref:hypothetical protein n=1 Tax=Mesorhizobium sp. M7A.F.Ca.CA.002.09.1.1 TaxID=2496739 RepID=UPI0019D1C848
AQGITDAGRGRPLGATRHDCALSMFNPIPSARSAVQAGILCVLYRTTLLTYTEFPTSIQMNFEEAAVP